jgi:hypothetical protein
MERLTAQDQLMLWPDEIWPQDIGALAVLDGSSLLDTDGRFRIEAVREAVAARLHLVPRFRQLLYVPPRRLGGPLWVDAANFELSDHIAEFRLPRPGDEAQLLLTIEQLRQRRLDRSRPLWQMWFLTGLPDRRVGLFVRIHHTRSPTAWQASRLLRSSSMQLRMQFLPPRAHGHRDRCLRRANSSKTRDAGAYSKSAGRSPRSRTR